MQKQIITKIKVTFSSSNEQKNTNNLQYHIHPLILLQKISKARISTKNQKTSFQQMVSNRSLGHKVGHNLIKLIENQPLIRRSTPVDKHSLYHLINLRLRNAVMYRPCHRFELHIRDEVIAVGVITREDLLNAVSGLEISHLRDDPINEDIKGDRLLDFHQAVDEFQYEGVHIIRSQLIQGSRDLNGVDYSGSVLIEDVEGVDQFLVILSEEARAPINGAWWWRVLVREVLLVLCLMKDYLWISIRSSGQIANNKIYSKR